MLDKNNDNNNLGNQWISKNLSNYPILLIDLNSNVESRSTLPMTSTESLMKLVRWYDLCPPQVNLEYA